MRRKLPHILGLHHLGNLEITNSQGMFVFDSQGRQYADFESGIWCASLGYSHPRVTRCIQHQAETIIHLAPQNTSLIAEDAARTLLRHMPFEDGKVVFLSSGSEAVEMAIRLAIQYTDRKNLVTFGGSYLGAYGIAGGQAGQDNWTRISIDSCLDCQRDTCDLSCNELAGMQLDTVAAFVLEPVLGSGGIIVPPDKAVRFLTDTITAAGGLLVTDEVTTGLGRTGHWLGGDHYGLSPDIIAFGKTLGNGYPVSAIALKRDIANKIEKMGFQYVQSHQNDPLGCAIAKEVVTALEDEDLVSRSRHRGEYFKTLLQKTVGKLNAVSKIRGVGLMLALQLRSECFDSAHEVEEITEEMRDRGYIIGSKTQLFLLRFMPPFIIDEDMISCMCSHLVEILERRSKK